MAKRLNRSVGMGLLSVLPLTGQNGSMGAMVWVWAWSLRHAQMKKRTKAPRKTHTIGLRIRKWFRRGYANCGVVPPWFAESKVVPPTGAGFGLLLLLFSVSFSVSVFFFASSNFILLK